MTQPLRKINHSKLDEAQAPRDLETAQAFASSWNNLPEGSVYSFEQFAEWLEPLKEEDIKGRSVIELGCGNASLLMHMTNYHPRKLVGVDLGDSVLSAQKNMSQLNYKNWQILKQDLTKLETDGYDIAYSIGVLHHLKEPLQGFKAVIRNTRPGGRFHCWVYAHEGNALVRSVVEPVRRLACKLPWWLTKYGLATCMVVPYYFYSKLLARWKHISFLKRLPMYEYSLWIAERGFLFYRHVAFDQLVTPQTVYIKREQIEKWMQDHQIEDSYIIFRNGNSWKFGGRKTLKNL